MKGRVIANLAACLLGSAALLGCRTMADRHNTGVVPSMSTSAMGGLSERQLPPKQTAVACLATAKEMEKAEQFEPAIELYERARTNDPNLTGQVCRRLAVIYDCRGEFDKARKEYERALTLTPKDAELYNNLGYSCYCQGRLADAHQYLKKALDHSPHHTRAWNNMGLVLAMQENQDGSLAAFKKALSPAQAHCNLAFMLAAQGKRDAAMEHYMKALDLDHNLPMARTALAKLADPNFGAAKSTMPADVVRPAVLQAPADASPPLANAEVLQRMQ